MPETQGATVAAHLLASVPMDARNGVVECPAHGDQQATFVCRHIVDGVKTRRVTGFWTSCDPDNPRPDAWCSECEARVQATAGEWTDESEAFAGVTLLCGACYDDARRRNLAS